MDHATEVLAEVAGRAEAAPFGHRLHRQVAGLEQSLGQVDALPEQPLVGRGPGGGLEPTGERPGAHGRPLRQILDGHRVVEMLLDPGHGVGEQVGVIELGQGLLDELGLAPVALGRHDQLAGQLGGHLAAVVLAHDVEAGGRYWRRSRPR